MAGLGGGDAAATAVRLGGEAAARRADAAAAAAIGLPAFQRRETQWARFRSTDCAARLVQWR